MNPPQPYTQSEAYESLLKLLQQFTEQADAQQRLRATVRMGWLIPLRDAGLIIRVDDGREGWIYQTTQLGRAWLDGKEYKTLAQLRDEAKNLCQRLGKRRVLVFIYGQDFIFRAFDDHRGNTTHTITTPTDYERRYTDERLTLGELWEAVGNLQVD